MPALTGSDAQASALIALLEAVGLAGYEDVLCARLSAGKQRRVALARLGLDGSPLWLLDEPFTALDTGGQALVRQLIAGHREQAAAARALCHPSARLPCRSRWGGGCGRELDLECRGMNLFTAQLRREWR